MNKRYWLRGGLWVGGIYALLFIIYVIFAYVTEGDSSQGAGFGLALIPVALSGLPTVLLLDLVDSGNFAGMSLVGEIFVLFLFCTLQWFVIGSIIGWIYGKFKNRNNLIN